MEAISPALISLSPEETARRFQIYLRRYENDDRLVILKAVNTSGSKLGDNYTSVMTRTKVVGKRGDGSPYVKGFMMKTLSNDRPIAALLGVPNLFLAEGHVYDKILPVLGDFGPPCIYFDPETIIMEDLAEKGYVNCDRRKFLDFEHTACALKKLADYHALTLAIKINNPRQFDELASPLKEIVYKQEVSPQMEMCATSSAKMTIQTLETIQPRTKEIQGIIDIYKSFLESPTIYERLQQILDGPKQKYHTICHGDPWINNLLFLHDQNGRIIDIKMVDYQIGRHVSVGTDIHYFIYSSVHSSLIEKSYESLLKIYHNAFLNKLRQSRVSEKILADLGPDWLEKEMQACKIYGLSHGCWLLHAILADEEDAKKFETFDPQNMEASFDLMDTALSQKKIDRLKCIVTHYYRRYHLGIITDDIEPLTVNE